MFITYSLILLYKKYSLVYLYTFKLGYYTNIMNNVLTQRLELNMDVLTETESKIADMIAFGVDLDEISKKLSISHEKINEHINSICSKICYRKTITLEEAAAMYL